MSIDNWQAGEVFTARVYKRLTNRPDVLWANTYELFAVAAFPDAETAAVQVLDGLAMWESQFHLQDVTFDRGVFSTHIEDGQPYNPTSFTSRGYSGIVGQRTVTGEGMSLQNCLLVRRQVGYGRTGRVLYRRALSEEEVTSPGGEPALTVAARASLQAIFDGGWDGGAESPTLIEWLRNVYTLDLVMVGNNPNGEGNIRTVSGFQVAGVVVKAYNNAYYNRNTPPAPTP